RALWAAGREPGARGPAGRAGPGEGIAGSTEESRTGDPPAGGKPLIRPSARGAVHGRDDGLERGCGGVGVDADPPQHLAVDVALQVGRRLGVAARAQGVLDVVEDADLDADGVDGVDEGGDGAVADAFELADLAVDADVGAD